MRILQVVHNFLPRDPVGGTEVYTYSLSKELSRHNEVLIFYGNPNMTEFIKRDNYDGLNTIAINASKYRRGATRFNLLPLGIGCINRKIDEVFQMVIEEFKPDIIHFHHLLNLSLNLVSIAHRLKIPIVFTLHDYYLLCHRVTFMNSNYHLCRGGCGISHCLKCFLGQYKYSPQEFVPFLPIKRILPGELQLRNNSKILVFKLNLLFSLKEVYKILSLRLKLLKEIMRGVDVFIAPSRYLFDKFIENGFPAYKFTHIEYGIDTKFLEVSRKNPCGHLRFAFMGSLTFYKGISILTTAFSDIKAATLDIYGLPGILADELQIKLRDNKNIRFRGYFKPRELSRVFSDIDILIVPSIWEENSPLAIREAFASKVPVIASDIGGMPEIVKDGQGGLLFKPGDPKDLYGKIKYLIDNPSQINIMRSKIPKVKTIEENAVEIEVIYQRIYQNKK